MSAATAGLAAQTLQLDLFAGGRPSFDREFGTARRIQLDADSWVEHVPQWLRGADEVFEELRDRPAWEQRDRWMIDQLVTEPRLTAEYPDVTAAPAVLREISTALSEHYLVPYDGLWLNLYRTNRDSTSWHGDGPSCRRTSCIVPVLSLGATRRFLIRPRDGGPSVPFTPHAGDLIVMGGRCQLDWRHCVPKQATPTSARISVNFSSSRQATPDPSE